MITGASPREPFSKSSPGLPQRFPKTARLRKSRDFRFRPYKRFGTELFTFLYTGKGQGRLGISISKKVLRRATARNRVRRLLKETFRLQLGELATWDIHVIGAPGLTARWERLKREDVERVFAELKARPG